MWLSCYLHRHCCGSVAPVVCVVVPGGHVKHSVPFPAGWYSPNRQGAQGSTPCRETCPGVQMSERNQRSHWGIRNTLYQRYLLSINKNVLWQAWNSVQWTRRHFLRSSKVFCRVYHYFEQDIVTLFANTWGHQWSPVIRSQTIHHYFALYGQFNRFKRIIEADYTLALT